jgi:hypothetical protein
VLVEVFVESHAVPPKEIVIDVDATDDPLHGDQEGRFFHGYYGHYCYLPLYFFCGDRLLCARLREADEEPATGCVEELSRIVAQVRAAWPECGSSCGGDSGFCREAIMSWWARPMGSNTCWGWPRTAVSPRSLPVRRDWGRSVAIVRFP